MPDETVTQAFSPVLLVLVLGLSEPSAVDGSVAPKKGPIRYRGRFRQRKTQNQKNRPEGLRYQGHEIPFESPAIALS